MYVQRHGESEANERGIYSGVKSDPGLIEAGRAHIESLVPYYAGIDLKAIITSHSKRAIETAEIIADHLGLPITIDKALHEVDMGDLEGKPQDEGNNIKLFSSVMDNWLSGDGSMKFNNGESYIDIMERINHVTKNYLVDDDILIVSHAAFLACLMGQTMKYNESVFELFLPRGGRGIYKNGKWTIIDKRK